MKRTAIVEGDEHGQHFRIEVVDDTLSFIVQELAPVASMAQQSTWRQRPLGTVGVKAFMAALRKVIEE